MLDPIVEQVCTAVRARGCVDAASIDRSVRVAAPLLSASDQDRIARRVRAEIDGFGALQDFMDDPTVREIMVNHGDELWVDRAGGLEFIGEIETARVESFIERVLAPLARRLDIVNPIVDARLADGSRLCAVIPPVANGGTCLTVRRFSVAPIGVDQFLDQSGVQVVNELVRHRCNVVVSGSTSSGKTTFLNALTELVPEGERIVTIEDTAELQPRAAHVVSLECRPGNNEGAPAVAMDQLLRTALRLRPDRLVIGEIRGDEAVELLQAMNTVHDGTLATCHANSADDSLRRLESLVMRCTHWPADVVREHIRSSVDVIVHVARSLTGERGVAQIAEVIRDVHGPIRTRLLWADACRHADLRNARV